jgi:hypothetical protein
MLDPKRTFLIVVAGLAGFIGATVGVNVFMRSLFHGGAAVSELKQYTISGMSIALPSAPVPLPITLPPEVKSMVVTMENVEAKKKNFESMVTKVVYTAGIVASAEGAMNGAIANMMKSEQLTRVSENRTPAKISGLDGFRCSAVFSKAGEELEMQGVYLAKASTLWGILVLYRKDDSRSRDTALEIVASLSITSP